MDYISTNFDIDSSSRFLFTARTDTHTDKSQTQLITIPTPQLPAAWSTRHRCVGYQLLQTSDENQP